MHVTPQNCGCPVEAGASILNSQICSGTLLFMTIIESIIRGRCDISTPCQTVQPVKKVRHSYDFIVVGGGTAGAVVAGRLSEFGNFKVLLLEAGGPEPIGDRLPSFYRTYWSNPEVDWSYRTVPSKKYCLDQEGRGCKWLRGKALGGTSIMNGMMYSRGHPADFDDWVEAGAAGWSWEENLPYFVMSEGNMDIGSVVSSKYHSASGPMPVKQFNHQPPFVHELLKAINETGVPVVRDINDPSSPEGFAIAQAFNANGQRYTTARAFLRRRPNLDVALHAHVSKVLTKTDQGETKAIGVEYYDKFGKLRTVFAAKEVILCAGALNSPQIMLLSGIGPKETLKKFKIPIVKDLPVGKNLRNHVAVVFDYILKKVENAQALDWSVLTEYMLNRRGPMSSTGITQVTGFLYSSLADRKREQSDLQFFFNGFYAECSKTGQIGEKMDYPSRGTNISVNAVALLPKSVGHLTLQSTNPFDPPLFHANYFSHPVDMVMVKDASRYVQKLFATKIMKKKHGAVLDSTRMGMCAKLTFWSDKWLECMIRLNTDPQNHQLGTAAIGLVIDTSLRVYGIPNLRVIDASSLPTLPTGNPVGTIMMVAERGVELIKNDWYDYQLFNNEGY